MGAHHTGSDIWPTSGGAVPWGALVRVDGGLRTLRRGLLSARAGVLSAGVVHPSGGHGPWSLSVWMAPTCGFSSSHVAVPSHVSLVLVCVCVWVCGCVCGCGCVRGGVCVCMCEWVFICMCMSCVFMWGREGWVFGRQGFSLLFLASVRHFVLLLYEKCHINKIWFDLIWYYWRITFHLKHFSLNHQKVMM